MRSVCTSVDLEVDTVACSPCNREEHDMDRDVSDVEEGVRAEVYQHSF